VELSQSVEFIGREAFSADEDGSGRGAGAQRACRRLFLTAEEESWLRRRRRGCQVFIAGKGPETEEKRQIALSGIISHSTAKCGGDVHDLGVVEITANSVFGTNYPRNIVDLDHSSSCFYSEDEPGQWICLDFKTLRIEPTHYTIRVSDDDYLKSWAVESSDDGASWTEIDRRENNSDLNSKRAVKTFAVSRSSSFGRIRLRQTGPNHRGNDTLVLSAFELFGAVAGCPMTL
jgi:hypothetical protein